MTRPRKLTPGQASIVRRAVKLRRQLSIKALAKRFDVSIDTIGVYARQDHKR